MSKKQFLCILEHFYEIVDFCCSHDLKLMSDDDDDGRRNDVRRWSGVPKIEKMKLASKSLSRPPLTPGTTLESILGVLRKL